jgi:precorrin-2 dehydrogenase/sirohydrochlorin ferrochelatase
MGGYPINLDITDRFCVVVGGGGVAVRKVEGLLVAGARVRVISPRVADQISIWAEQGAVELIRRPFAEHDVSGAFMVFAATDDPSVQDYISTCAVAAGALLNRADTRGRSDFYLPAACTRGDLLITVSTGGASPALAGQIRRRLEQTFGVEYALLVHLMGQIRQAIPAGGEAQPDNRQLYFSILDSPVLTQLRNDQWAELEKTLREMLPGEIDSALLVANTRAVAPHFVKNSGNDHDEF